MTMVRKALGMAFLVGLGVSMAHAQEWDPNSEDDTPSWGVQQRLRDAEMFVYLDKDCKKVAVVVAGHKQRENYLPNLAEVDWAERLKKMPDGDLCKTNKDDWMDLPSTVHPFNSEACKASTSISSPGLDIERMKTSCFMAVDIVAFLVILNQRLEPLLMLRDVSARRATPLEVPARLLGHKPDQGGACSPVTPPPCLAPRSGKLIGNPPMCICSL